jgi:catechol 2,3-dioxygenase-like lactoylglutathione lyase family enzyme
MNEQSGTLPPGSDGVLETAIYTGDLEAARQFYGGILGFEEVTARENTFVFFRCGGTMVLVFNPEQTKLQPLASPALPIPGHGAAGAGHICFRASGERLGQWKEHLIANGIGIESEITWENGARSIYFRDPAGNSLEFAQPRLWGYDEEDTIE